MPQAELAVRLIPGPHLRKGDDWHEAFIPIVNRMLSQLAERDEVEAPAYPLFFHRKDFDLIFEIGAYWEGALYALYKISGSLDSYRALQSVQSSLSTSNAPQGARLFDQVFNSHGQLKWLKAYLVRREFINQSVLTTEGDWTPDELRRAARSNPEPQLRWLARFVEQHHEEGERYHNPFFGGQNPLHLGMILSKFERP